MIDSKSWRPQSPPPLPSRPPFWRHPAALGLAALLAALLAVLIVARLIGSGEPELQDTPVRVEPAPAPVAEAQWPKLDEVAAPPVASYPPIEPVEAPGRNFIAKLNLQPRLVRGQVKGFVVQPDDPSILKGTPLQAGDVLLEVDGLALDAARAAKLAENVGDYQDVFVKFERGSTEQEDMLPLGAR